MADAVSKTEYGVRYPDGTEDWTVTSYYGFIDDGPGQDQFKKEWLQRMRVQGMAVEDEAAEKIVFLKRTAVTTYEEVTDITDHEYVPKQNEAPDA